MSVTNLRRAGSLDSRTLDSIAEGSHEQLTIRSVDQIDWTPIVENHPYPDQTIVRTIATYHEPSSYTSGRDIEIEFEIRAGSELVLFEYQTDLSTTEPVTNSFRQAAGNNLQIYHSLHAPEDALWEFLSNSNRVINISVLDEGQEVTYTEVEETEPEDVVGEYAIASAEVVFEYEGNQMLVSYNDGSLQVESDWSLGREYVIQLFERDVMG